MTLVLDGTSGVTFPDTTRQISAAGPGFRNKIINGAMMIDQRNAGSPVTTDGSYSADRWRLGANYGIVSLTRGVLPAGQVPGFSYYLTFGSGSAGVIAAGSFNSIAHHIEGYNIADLSWGSANAKAVTLSFWVNTTIVTGNFGVALRNGAMNRSYVASFNVPTAGVWQYVSIVIPGDTTGTWATDNTLGIRVVFDCGVGSTYSTTASGAWQAGDFFGLSGGVKVSSTNGAYLNITGVQLEAGSVATPFEYRQIGTELALCQRYYHAISETPGYMGVATYSGASLFAGYNFPVSMRAIPTSTTSWGTLSNATAGGITITPRLIHAQLLAASLGANYSALLNLTYVSAEF